MHKILTHYQMPVCKMHIEMLVYKDLSRSTYPKQEAHCPTGDADKVLSYPAPLQDPRHIIRPGDGNVYLKCSCFLAIIYLLLNLIFL